MTIVDDEVSVDNLIEDYLISEPNNEYIQSCDIVAFNKICEFPPLFCFMQEFCTCKTEKFLLERSCLKAVYTQYCFVLESRGFFKSNLSVNLALLQIRPRMKQCR
jgi:hypothetical protein